MRTTVTVAAALAAAVAGCGGGEERAPQRAATATPAAQSTPVPSIGKPLRFRSADGKRLEGRFLAGARRRSPAIVLTHEVRGGPDQFAALVPLLHDAGYATLAYKSRDGGGFDETLLARDIAGAVHALRRRRDVAGDRIGLIGASIGGSAATWAIATKRLPGVRAAIGLSAVEGPAMIQAGTDGRFKPHDLLLITDKREAENAKNITSDAGGKGVTTFVAPRAGHGVALIPDADVRTRILAWLKARL
jgi:dienelactone hydrolase